MRKLVSRELTSALGACVANIENIPMVKRCAMKWSYSSYAANALMESKMGSRHHAGSLEGSGVDLKILVRCCKRILGYAKTMLK